MYICVAHTHTHTPGACGNQRRTSYPLELDLHIPVNCHVGARNQAEQEVLLTAGPFSQPLLEVLMSDNVSLVSWFFRTVYVPDLVPESMLCSVRKLP